MPGDPEIVGVATAVTAFLGRAERGGVFAGEDATPPGHVAR